MLPLDSEFSRFSLVDHLNMLVWELNYAGIGEYRNLQLVRLCQLSKIQRRDFDVRYKGETSHLRPWSCGPGFAVHAMLRQLGAWSVFSSILMPAP